MVSQNFTKLLYGLAFMLVSGVMMAQISGTVSDAETGEALIGANVLIKGTSTGTVTDFDGNFTIDADQGDMLVISYIGYSAQEVTVNGSNLAIALSSGEALQEVVVVGYGSQSAKEITSSVVKLDNKDFNQGAISDPSQLLQGKVAGLQVYNRGGDPNRASVIRMRGISTVGANVQPLVVVDGIIGASLDNVDPNDIESVNVLKDGSAAAIYGSRGSSGVIIVTTKKGSLNEGQLRLNYNGQFASSSPVNGISVMSASEFLAAGGTDLGNSTDWIKEVTRNGFSQIHNVSASGGAGNTTYRVSANIRDVEGILQKSGFDQFNTRVNLSTRVLNDKLKIDFNSSLTNRRQQNGFNEALRYAVTYNPTAPVYGQDSPFEFNSDQFGGYFETLGLFDSFNPKSIIEQNRNDGERKEFNYGVNLGYDIIEGLSLNFRTAKQNITYKNTEYYPVTSNFRGNATSITRKGLAKLYNNENDFNLYETYATYTGNFGGTSDLTLTGGYSYQEDQFSDQFLEIGDFPDNGLDYSNAIEWAQDLDNAGYIDANSSASPKNKIIAFFGRANYTYDNAIFVNASLRREGSTKLGEDNKWGLFPAFGIGADINRYANINNVDLLKVRFGYGVTGSLPREYGLSKPIRRIVNGSDGSVSTVLERAANPDLKWEEKHEMNLGFEFGMNRFSATLDLYNRDIRDFILERTVEASEFGVDKRFENSGEINTRGLELALNFDFIQKPSVNWNSGLVFSHYKTKLEDYIIPAEMRGNLGSPGQNDTYMIRVKVGEEIGQIWGPEYTGVSEGSPVFADVNGDGSLKTDQSQALDEDVDFTVLGSGIPDLELGWSNQVTFGAWTINAFFRGAFGHSLVNTFRAFYEPQVASQSSYNYMNTDLKVDGLGDAKFSSLYVEKADFFKLDNFTLSRRFDFDEGAIFDGINLSFIAQNPFVFTKYTGTDPEPSLVDYAPQSNGDVVDYSNPDVLTPGIDRRSNYFSARTFTLGVNVNF